MIKLFCILVGLYLVIDALYLAGHSDNENRQCTIAKYVCALVSGLYFVLLSGKDLIIQYGLLEADHHLFISDDAAHVMLLFGITIALFMWPDTFWRVIDWLQRKRPAWHLWLVSNFNIKSRRSNDEARA
jgi:hypothetical protein